VTPIDWNPDETKLRQFGWIALPGFGLIGAVLGWRLGWFASGQWLAPAALWGVGLVAALLACVMPRWLKPLYLLLSAVSAVVGPVVATVAMGLIFLFVFVPLGLLFRMRGRDELRLRPGPDAGTFWERSPRAPEPRRYFRQF